MPNKDYNNFSSKTINVLGYACGLGAGIAGCGNTIAFLKENKFLEKINNAGLSAILYNAFEPISGFSKLENIHKLNMLLAGNIYRLVANNNLFLTIDGDHTSAIGTWSGTAYAMKNLDEISLIWIDAHLDSHTPETSHSKNIHGMPLAVLLGYGYTELVSINFKGQEIAPDKLVIIGAHDFEIEELIFLKNQDVKIYFLEDVMKKNFKDIFLEAIEIVNKNTVGYGISIDLDALNVESAPRVGIRNSKGLKVHDLINTFGVNHNYKTNLLEIEICEYNSLFEENMKTFDTLLQLIYSLINHCQN